MSGVSIQKTDKMHCSLAFTIYHLSSDFCLLSSEHRALNHAKYRQLMISAIQQSADDLHFRQRKIGLDLTEQNMAFEHLPHFIGIHELIHYGLTVFDLNGDIGFTGAHSHTS